MPNLQERIVSYGDLDASYMRRNKIPKKSEVNREEFTEFVFQFLKCLSSFGFINFAAIDCSLWVNQIIRLLNIMMMILVYLSQRRFMSRCLYNQNNLAQFPCSLDYLINFAWVMKPNLHQILPRFQDDECLAFRRWLD